MASRKKKQLLAPVVRAVKLKRASPRRAVKLTDQVFTATVGKKRRTRRAKTATPVELKNSIFLLLDESGSMNPIRDQTVNTVNDVVQSLKVGSLASGQNTEFTLVRFNSEIKPSTKTLIEWVKPLGRMDYMPGSSTRLFDAVGHTLTDALRSDDGVTSYVVNVVTDGEDMGSHQFNSNQVVNLIKKAQATDRFTIVFLVPPGYKNRLCQDFDIPTGNVQEWEATEKGVRGAGSSLQSGYSNYFVTRSAGGTSTKSFFTTDLSKVKSSDVKRSCQNMTNNVEVAQVKAEIDIATFVEKKGYKYTKGSAFYQLTKDEKVQSFKNIMLMEKGKSDVYGGDKTRDLLGLPSGQEVLVKPGNHANWDVFIQSTSANRKLVRGTNLLIVK